MLKIHPIRYRATCRVRRNWGRERLLSPIWILLSIPTYVAAYDPNNFLGARLRKTRLFREDPLSNIEFLPVRLNKPIAMLILIQLLRSVRTIRAKAEAPRPKRNRERYYRIFDLVPLFYVHFRCAVLNIILTLNVLNFICVAKFP